MQGLYHPQSDNKCAQKKLQYRALHNSGVVGISRLDETEYAIDEAQRAKNRKNINGVYRVGKYNKKYDDYADNRNVSSPVKWFFLHKSNPFMNQESLSGT